MKQLVERKQYMQILRDLKEQNIIKVITGVRRCGKSTLLRMFADELLQNGVTQEQIQFYNFEDPDIYTIGNWKDIYDYIKVRLIPDKMNYVFLDEVQNVDVFQRLVDGLFIKNNVDLYVTGSNAYLLSGELATLLTGRYIETSILPLQFSEYYDFIAEKSPNLSKIDSLADYIIEGGIPEYYNQKKISQKQATKQEDKSHWLENAVYFELLRRYRDVYVGKIGNKEVDFVVVDYAGYTSYYQVAWTTMQSEATLERELTSLRAIKDSNPKYLLTTDRDNDPVYDGIRKLNVVEWMLSNKEYKQ